jgi:hypothetical protein
MHRERVKRELVDRRLDWIKSGSKMAGDSRVDEQD